MLQLPNNCRAGKFSVTPANWKSQSAKVNSIWKISYWFYDDTLNQKKKVVIKGANRLTTLSEKQDHIREVITYETELLVDKGYNHITKQFTATHIGGVLGHTPFIPALEACYEKLDIECKDNVKSALKYIKPAIISLQYDRLKISDVTLLHVSQVLNKACQTKSACTYNHYRTYLSVLFKQLVKEFAVLRNPVRDLEKKKEVRRIRQELTKVERQTVKAHLSKRYPDFWRFVNIFFHSGSRITEMLKLKKSDIDIAGRRFKVLVIKGNQASEQWRPIKDLVYAEWEHLIASAVDGDHIFSVGLRPGKKTIRPEQVTRRWNEHVKQKLKITADMYSLKHSNLDETAGAIAAHEKGIKVASQAAGHTTPVITMKVYAQGEEGRRHETIRQVNNEF